MTAIDAGTRNAHADGTRIVDLNGATDDTASLQLLLDTLRLRDTALADHCLRSAHVAAAIAERMGAGEEEVRRSYLGALLHDVGKLGVAEAILWKPAGLDSTEWRAIRTHPLLGHRLVVDIVHENVAAAVLYHHERVDGAGYPFRVRLGLLPAEVRIVQVADAFDALTSSRPYEPPIPARAALREISRCAGTQFDAEVVAALQAVLEPVSGVSA